MRRELVNVGDTQKLADMDMQSAGNDLDDLSRECGDKPFSHPYYWVSASAWALAETPQLPMALRWTCRKYGSDTVGELKICS